MVRSTFCIAILAFATAFPLVAQSTVTTHVTTVGEIGLQSLADDGSVVTDTFSGDLPPFLELTTNPQYQSAAQTLVRQPQSFEMYHFMAPLAFGPNVRTIGGPPPAQPDAPQEFAGSFTSPQPVSGQIVVRLALNGFDLFNAADLTLQVAGQTFAISLGDDQLVAAVPVTVDANGVDWTVEASLVTTETPSGIVTSPIFSALAVEFTENRCYSALDAAPCPPAGNQNVTVGGPFGTELTFYAQMMTEPDSAGALLLASSPNTFVTPWSQCPVLLDVIVSVPVTFVPAMFGDFTVASVTIVVPPTAVGTIRSQFFDLLPELKTSPIWRVQCGG